MKTVARSRTFLLSACLLVALAFVGIRGELSPVLLVIWSSGTFTLLALTLSAALLISCGRLDISCGAAMSTVGMILVSFAGSGLIVAHLIALVFLFALYFAYFRLTQNGLPPVIVTLAGLLICRGLSTLLQACTIDRSLSCGLPAVSLTPPGASPLSGLHAGDYSAIVGVVGLVLVFALWRYRSREGIEHLAVGMNERSAIFARINVSRVRLIAFAGAAVMVYLSTIFRLYVQNGGGWAPNIGWGEELLAIAAAVIGGTRLSGGHFLPATTALAAAALYIGRDVIVADTGAPAEAVSVLFGILLLVFIWSDRTSARGQR